MTELTKLPKTNYRVRFQDCDPFGHLNNASFLHYFLNAREDHLRDFYDLNLDDHYRKTKKSWLSITNQLSYFKPVMVAEEISIQSQLIHFDQKSARVELSMFDKSGEVLKSICWMRVMYVDTLTGRSAAHDDETMELFSSVLMPVDQQNFEERNAFLLKLAKG